jgi:hypothetical protein
MAQGLALDHEPIARLPRGWVRLRWTSSTGAARAAGLGDDALADRVIPPGARPATAASPPPARILGDGGCGIGQAGEPPGVHLPYVGCPGRGFLCWGRCRGLRLLLRQLTRRPHHNTARGGSPPRLTILHLHLADDAVPRPASGRFRLGPPRFLHQERQGGLVLSPGFEVLAHGTGARDSGHSANPLLQTQPEGATPIGLTLRDHPPYPLHASGQTLRKRQWGFHAIAAVAIPYPDAPR